MNRKINSFEGQAYLYNCYDHITGRVDVLLGLGAANALHVFQPIKPIGRYWFACIVLFCRFRYWSTQHGVELLLA